MKPESVSVTLSIVVADNTHSNRTLFSEDWDFIFDRYAFKRLSEDEVQISFNFDALLKTYDKDGKLCDECPSEYLPEYQEYERELETILNLFSLELGSGLEIKEESYLFASATCRDNPINNRRFVSPSRAKILCPQLSKPENENDKKLSLALHLYRQSVSTNDPREKMAKLFAALEQLFYGKNTPLFSKEEIKSIQECINSLPLSPEKKKIVVDRARDSRKSPTTLIAENLELLYENELVSQEEKKQIVSVWNRYKSAITHGEIISRRDENFDYTVSEIDTIVDAILKRGVEHRLKLLETS